MKRMINKKSVMTLAHRYYKADFEGRFENFADALWQAWRDVKRGRRLIDSDTLEGQRSEFASAIRERNLLTSRGF